MIAENKKTPAARYGMTIDVDRCNGCGACMVACSVENNVPPANAAANDRDLQFPGRIMVFALPAQVS